LNPLWFTEIQESDSDAGGEGSLSNIFTTLEWADDDTPEKVVLITKPQTE